MLEIVGGLFLYFGIGLGFLMFVLNPKPNSNVDKRVEISLIQLSLFVVLWPAFLIGLLIFILLDSVSR